MNSDYPALEMLIAGRWEGTRGRETMPVHNPSTGEVLGELPRASNEDMDSVLAAAHSAFQLWRSKSAYDRALVLKRTADIMRDRSEYLARLITLELGKPVAESRLEVQQAAGMFEWNAEEARRAYGRVIPSRSESVRQLAVREPIGPVAAFSPWNAPAATPARKISSVLAAGCSIVIKPAEETPGIAIAIARILMEAGLPTGVLSMVFGDPALISQRLLESPIIKGITFTGSTGVGKQLAGLAVQTMKRMTLELGGHAPVVVFDDVDADAVARAAVRAKFRNAGQVCTSPTRFYIQESIYDRFVSSFSEAMRSISVGDGFDAGTNMGPLAHPRRVEAMEAFIADAEKRGIQVTGGKRCGNRGNFIMPSLLENVGTDAMVSNAEPFGPLAATTPFRNVDEVVGLANRLPFGLAAYVMTNDLRRAEKMTAMIESGNVIVNHWQVSLPETPFGGYKDSGLNSEGGIEGIQAFQNTKFVSLAS